MIRWPLTTDAARACPRPTELRTPFTTHVQSSTRYPGSRGSHSITNPKQTARPACRLPSLHVVGLDPSGRWQGSERKRGERGGVKTAAADADAGGPELTTSIAVREHRIDD